jgi:hypothetical protein
MRCKLPEKSRAGLSQVERLRNESRRRFFRAERSRNCQTFPRGYEKIHSNEVWSGFLTDLLKPNQLRDNGEIVLVGAERAPAVTLTMSRYKEESEGKFVAT